MPVIDGGRLPIPDGAAFEASFWKGKTNFRPLLGKVYREVWRVTDTAPMIRLLQGVMRPTWTLEHRVEAPEYRALAPALLSVLAEANAPVLFHSPHEAPPEGNVIRLTWHGNGKARQRWHYKAGHLPHRLHFDREGYSGWSEVAALDQRALLAVRPEEGEEHYDAVIRPHLASGASKYRQDASRPVEGEGFVFVPLQLVNDSVISLKFFEAGYLDGMRRAVARLLEAGLPVIVKRHPHCDSPEVARFLAGLPEGVVSTASVHRLIPRSRCVLTLNSGVGFEALMHLKPVVAMGRADYAPLAAELRDPDGVVQAVATARLDPALAKRFLLLSLEGHGLDPRDPASVRRAVLRALCHNMMELAPR
ncbi:hypothetical protein [Muricoccus radiodurans]|uniref:capsular polysaccharide export protein, LipB/KpsS family n=1 Tax=Muricoccus radiodurans TaxID=2231721 RepID=UPI003CE6D76F